MANRIQIDHLTNMEMINRYRYDHEGVHFLEGLIGPFIAPISRRNNSLLVRDKILVALRYFATGLIQLNDGDLHGISQPTVSRVIEAVVSALSRPEVLQQKIQFPKTLAELQRNQAEFFGIARFLKVVGVIDGTHVPIKAPSINEEDFVNRKGIHSLNVQIALDPYDRIIDVVARWPGSVHDSRVLRNSGVWELFEGGHLPAGNFHLLGDSGYPCKTWLLTPYLQPQPGAQSAYNRSHKITRSKVERGIGQLKRRFAVLKGEVTLHHEKVCKIVLACAVLHNICKERNIPMPDGDDDNQQQPHNTNFVNNPRNNGLRYRDYIAQTYF